MSAGASHWLLVSAPEKCDVEAAFLVMLLASKARSRARSGVAAACLVAVWCSPCLGEPSASAKARARELIVLGDQHFEARQFELALERYGAAFELVPVPTVGIEVMKAQASLGLFLEARATALSVARSPLLEGEPAVFGEARQKALELAEILGPITPELRLSMPPGAALDLDGQSIGHLGPAAPPLRLNPGRHWLRLRAQNGATLERAIELRVAERRHEVLALPESRSPEVREPERVAGGAALPLPVIAAPSDDDGGSGTWIALGVAAAGVAVGVPAGVLALTEAANAESHCGSESCSVAADEHIQNSKTLGNVATVSFAVAGAAALYLTWQLFFASDPAPSSVASHETMRPLLSVERSRVELGLSGGF